MRTQREWIMSPRACTRGFIHCHVIEAGQVCSNIVHVSLTATVWAGQDPPHALINVLFIIHESMFRYIFMVAIATSLPPLKVVG